MRTAHQHAVWETPVPAYDWDSAGMIIFEDLNRPPNYRGGRFDQEAWASFVRTNEMLAVQAFYWGRFGIAPPGVVWC